MTDVEIRHAHLYCGMGGGKKGFNRGKARVGQLMVKPRCIGGIDSDPLAIARFNSIGPGRPGTVLDLFSLAQYRAFHGKEPPAGWREATVADIHEALGHEVPHVWFLSAPCKGFSGLLSETRSLSPKYQALNQLTLRGIWLVLEAHKDDPASVILFENVPRIATRGRHLLDQIVGLLRSYGYAVAETTHDCGELGGLAQSRKRFLLIARHTEKVPPFIYQPEKRPLRAVGDVLSKLPLPGDPIAGPMHRVPRLQWQTWVRLAFVEAGSDWRSLKRLKVENGVLSEYLLVPEIYNGAYGVLRWGDTANTVTSKNQPSSGSASVADPMTREFKGGHGVVRYDESAGTIAGESFPSNGAFAVADPQVDGHAKSVQLGVRRYDQPAGVVTGKMFVGGGPNSVADPKINRTGFSNVYRVVRFDEVGPAVTAGGHPTAGGASVADPRFPWLDAHENKFRVTKYNEAAGAVIGTNKGPGSGAASIADPRTGFGPATRYNVLHVVGFDQKAKTITGSNHPSGGAQSVADPRPVKEAKDLHGKFHVTPFDGHSRAVIAGRENGAGYIADPRPTNWPGGKYRVTGFDESAGAVIGASGTGNGAFAVADPAPGMNREPGDNYETGGHFGVVRWEQTGYSIAGHASYDNGWNSVADPRLPEATEHLVALIIAPDNTWHRPFTTLELGGLQSLIDPEEWLETQRVMAEWCVGKYSDTGMREHIGNAVPPDAAEAMSSVIYRALLGAMTGETFTLSSSPVWVRPIALALAVDIPT